MLLSLIADITGEAPPASNDALRLSEDLHLDSLGRVQLAAAIEQKLGMPPESGLLEQVQTLGELRSLIGGTAQPAFAQSPSQRAAAGPDDRAFPPPTSTHEAPATPALTATSAASVVEDGPGQHVYPRWPWAAPVQWLRAAFLELIMRPLVRFLAKPHVIAPHTLAASISEPVIIVANHVTTYDGPLVEFALPGNMRRHIAVAMSGEMLDDFRHARNPERAPGTRRVYPFGPIAYALLTALFNVFPLPRSRYFQRSFAHAGEALDRGYHVLIFPEGTRSASGQLARFRPGIGLLVKQSNTAVLPVAIHGLGELKQQRRGWFRSGKIEVHVGAPMRFAPEESESAITEQLHARVAELLGATNAVGKIRE